MDSNEIDPKDLERLTLQERLAAANGFALQPPIYALGTPVVELGRENFKRSRQEFEALPEAREVIGPFLNRVAAEARTDLSKRIVDLRMLPDGRVGDEGASTGVFLTPDGAFRSLLYRAGCPEAGAAATYLATIPAPRRAREVNEWLEHADPEVTVKLRTRNALARIGSNPDDLEHYGRELYGLVTDRYVGGFEVDVIGRVVLDAIARNIIPGDCRASIAYDGTRAKITLLWHSDLNPERVCAGEIFKVGSSLTAEDDGTFGLHVDAEAWRNLCRNLIVIAQAQQEVASKRHVGDTASLIAWIYEALSKATSLVAGFSAMWDNARRLVLDSPNATRDIPYHLLSGGHEPEIVGGVYRGLIRGNRLALPGYRGEIGIAALTDSWRKESDFTKAGIVNGISRLAHEGTFKRIWTTDDLEAAAGTILRSDRPFDFVDRDKAAA